MNKVCRSLCLLLAVLVLLSIHSLANAFNLPDTGQTICYDSLGYVLPSCASTGQDGEYNINSMNYTDNGNGMVTDNNTGLMWQKCSMGQNNDTACSGDASTYNWYQATGTYHATHNSSSQNICGSLNASSFGGHSDWRVPSKKELITIVDYSVPYSGPTIMTEYFPNTNHNYYWSSTTYVFDTSLAWKVPFYDGSVELDAKYMSDFYVRCVRGGQALQGLSDNNGGTVTDNKTGLMWQKCSAGQNNDPTCSGSASTRTWSNALIYCNELSLGSQTDWRLPNVKELESLTVDTIYNPSINTAFYPRAQPLNYWSSTTSIRYQDSAWAVHFYHGGVRSQFDFQKDSHSYYVRCVRGGQGESSYVRLMREGSPVNTFNNIQDAYNNAQAGDIIQAKDLVSTETQTFVATKAVSLKGGYDSGFASNPGFTTINGNMTIIGGKVTIEKLIIK
jgi:hypothetical protein